MGIGSSSGWAGGQTDKDRDPWRDTGGPCGRGGALTLKVGAGGQVLDVVVAELSGWKWV